MVPCGLNCREVLTGSSVRCGIWSLAAANTQLGVSVERRHSRHAPGASQPPQRSRSALKVVLEEGDRDSLDDAELWLYRGIQG